MNFEEVARALNFLVQNTWIKSSGVLHHSELKTFLRAPAPKVYIVFVKKHWVALFSANEIELEVFDSYGRSLISYANSFSKIANRITLENCAQLQQNDSFVCGHFCLMYVYYCSRRIPYCQFISRFSCNLLHNDLLVANFYNVYIRSNV